MITTDYALRPLFAQLLSDESPDDTAEDLDLDGGEDEDEDQDEEDSVDDLEK